MFKFDRYRYIFPPRPKNAIPVDNIADYDNNSMICQAKMNGSNVSIYSNGYDVRVMNRHNQPLTNFQLSKEEILRDLHKSALGQWQVTNGEYLNKNKIECGKSFNHKLIIFDILVFESDHLVGSTFSDRIQILDKSYGIKDSEKPYLYGVSDNIYRVKSYNSEFRDLYTKLTEHSDVVEGIVMKRKNARLEIGNTKDNNARSQIKCRVETKNYKF
jgi:hypothetical protein